MMCLYIKGSGCGCFGLCRLQKSLQHPLPCRLMICDSTVVEGSQMMFLLSC